MAARSVTLEIPDEVYEKLKWRSQQTKRSLEEEILTAFTLQLPVLPLMETEGLHAYDEVLDFLISGPSIEEIIKFQLSDTARQRAQSLLAKEREANVTADEAKELDFYVELGDFIGILRARALLQLQNEAKS